MKIVLRIIAAALPAVIGAACTKDYSTPSGSLCVNVQMEGEVATRAAMSSEELLSTARVSIYKGDFSGKVRDYVYSELPSTIHLPADDYRIDVVAGEAAKEQGAEASWEQKSYKGSGDIKISAGAVGSVTVTAKVSNIISNLTFDSSVDAAFESGYTCTVSLEKGGEGLEYTAGRSGADGYFTCDGFEPSLFWTFSGALKKNGEALTKSGEIANVEAGKRYKLNLKYTEKEGIVGFSLLEDTSTNRIEDNIIFEAASTGVATSTRYEIWAGHFTAHADVDESQYDKSGVYFEARQKGATAWSKTSANRDSEGTFSAEISGLKPSTEYEYRLVVKSLESGSEERIDATSTITTEAAPAIPNGGFETTSNAESSKYKSFYDPSSSDAALQTPWWGNGNYGSTLVGSSSVICYPDASDYKEGTQSVCLQSRWVVVKFAAGNLFSGHFGELSGTDGGTVYFGRPFTARPTALRLWYKYSGGVINRESSNVPSEGKKGNYDKASIRIALGTWDYRKYGGDAASPIKIDTTDPDTFVDFSTDGSTIAFGEKIVASDASNSTNTWQYITIPLKYNSTTKYPTHIVISCAASMYGDYFSGYDASKLWLDGMELLYE